MTHITFLIAWLFSLPGMNRKMPFYIFSFGILFLFLFLRYGYGNDYFSYYHIHELINDGQPVWGENDILFKYLNLLSYNFYWLIVITSLFYTFTMHYLIKNNLKVEEYWVAVLLLLINPYLFLLHLSSIRQTIAICFFIFAVNFAVKRKILMYIVFIMIASGFHKSALILTPVYFLLNDKKINKKRMIVVCGILALLLGTPLFEILLIKALQYFPMYFHYIQEASRNSIRSTLISSFFFFLIALNINKLEGKELVYGKLALTATVISILTYKFSNIARIAMYFDIFIIIAMPFIFSKIRAKTNRRLLFMVMITLYLLRYVSFFNSPIWSESYGTYRTIIG